MLIDFHAHTSGISRCCRANAQEVLNFAKSRDIDGIILTNHYKRSYAADGNYTALAKRYIEEFHHTKALGDAMGMRVFFGIEVTMDFDEGLHMLIYGVPEIFIMEHPTIFEYSIEKLYIATHAAGGAVVQAHPLRGNIDRLVDTKFLDGIEINNHHIYEGTHLEHLSAIAKEAGLILTSGGDFHNDTPRPRCGVYLDENITNDGIATFIKETPVVRFAMQEVGCDTSNDVVFTRKTKK